MQDVEAAAALVAAVRHDAGNRKSRALSMVRRCERRIWCDVQVGHLFLRYISFASSTTVEAFHGDHQVFR